jgi:hypothetical protein
MIIGTVNFPIRRITLSGLCLAAVWFLAPWPGPQTLVHAMIVLGLAPSYRSPLVAALWAASAGWMLEGSLRIYPHLGGTPLADIFACLVAHMLLRHLPPQNLSSFWGRLAAFVAGHAILVHFCVRLASDTHAWGTGWLWALLSIPLWGTLVMRLGVSQTRR